MQYLYILCAELQKQCVIFNTNVPIAHRAYQTETMYMDNTTIKCTYIFAVEPTTRELPSLQPELHDFVALLLENAEVSVLGASRGPVGKVIHALFAAAQKVWYSIRSQYTCITISLLKNIL